jgi:hypothetical protein
MGHMRIQERAKADDGVIETLARLHGPELVGELAGMPAATSCTAIPASSTRLFTQERGGASRVTASMLVRSRHSVGNRRITASLSSGISEIVRLFHHARARDRTPAESIAAIAAAPMTNTNEPANNIRPVEPHALDQTVGRAAPLHGSRAARKGTSQQRKGRRFIANSTADGPPLRSRAPKRHAHQRDTEKIALDLASSRAEHVPRAVDRLQSDPGLRQHCPLRITLMRCRFARAILEVQGLAQINADSFT